MSARLRSVARFVLTRAVRGRASRGTDWGEAMLRELDEIDTGWASVRWAASGLRAAWRDRLAHRPVPTPLGGIPRRVRNGIVAAGVAAVALVLTQQFLLTVTYQASSSMAPTVQAGDRVLLDRLGFRLSGFAYGDVVVVNLGVADGSTEPIMKRVLGLPGDTMSCLDGHLLRNGRAVADNAGTCATARVPADALYLVGDALEVSRDSRHYGPVQHPDVVGRVLWGA